MVKIFNPVSGPNPIASVLRNLGQQLYGDQTANAVKQEQLYALQRGNVETDNLMRHVATQGGVHNLGSDPITQATLIGAGYDPAQFGEIGLIGAAAAHGARDPRTQAWQVGTGQPYRNTAGAFDADLAETARHHNLQSADRRYGVDQSIAQQRYEFDQMPEAVIGQRGEPRFVPRSELTRTEVSPILSETQQRGTLLGRHFDNLPDLDPTQREVLGANPSQTSHTPKNYVLGDRSYITYDGVTDAQTGQPLPPGGYIGSVEGTAEGVGLTNSVNTDLQSDIISADKFTVMADRMLELTKDPAAFGLVGNLRSKGQEVGQALGAVSNLFGASVPDMAREAREDLNAHGLGSLMPELYDPKLPAVAMLGGLMLYSGASALAGQENRSVSDADIQMMRRILGDPMGIFESAQSVRVKVGLAKDIVQEHRRLAQGYLDRGIQIPQDGSLVQEAAANVLSRAGAPEPRAPASAAPPQVERWERDPDTGQLRRAQ